MADDQHYDMDEYGMSYRKNPPRIRKKSRYYEEYYEATPQYKARESPRFFSPIRPLQPDDSHRMRRNAKQHKALPSSVGWRNAYANPERRTAQVNAVRLRNVLKLPKAHKWVFYEWLYSNLDRPLLLSENDFRICLRENFPNVKTRRLTRAHWSLLRRLMGKPRRCSAAFFDEERRSLNEKREKIRTLQATRSVQLEFLRDLPDDMHVPMPLIIGTRINARVRYPTDGLYPGKVDAIDSLRHCYRVTFDKANLGTRSIPDYEVISIEPQETIPLSAYKTQHKASRNLFMSPARLLAQSALQGKRHMHHHKIAHAVGGATSDFGIHDCPLCQSGDGSSSTGMSASVKAPSMGEMTSGIGGAALSLNDPSSSGGRLLLNESDIYGGYPMKFLVMVTKLSKILEVKKMCVDELQDLNTDAERKISNQSEISLGFQHKYLTLIVHLERLNKELNQYLIHVLQYANEIAQEHGVPPLEQPADFKQRCDEDAYDIVNRVKSIQVQRLRNMKNMDLITKLTGILVQVRSLSEQETSTPDCSSVLDSLRDLKATLHSSNVHTFEDILEVKVHHVMSGLNTQGNLHSFLYMHPNHMQYV
uniref:DIRP domain-containing protein n=1 Tax=Mesocestoides corti TaxID=53468 RepID=A0A5K3EJN6_MESCO